MITTLLGTDDLLVVIVHGSLLEDGEVVRRGGQDSVLDGDSSSDTAVSEAGGGEDNDL